MLRWGLIAVLVGMAASIVVLIVVAGSVDAPRATTFGGDEPPVTKGATLEIASLDLVSFGQYLDRHEGSRSEYGRAELERAGALVGLFITVTGYRYKRLLLQYRVIDSRTDDQVQHSREERYYTPYANKDSNDWPIWVPRPRGGDRRFFVEFELLDDQGASALARERTPEFRGA